MWRPFRSTPAEDDDGLALHAIPDFLMSPPILMHVGPFKSTPEEDDDGSFATCLSRFATVPRVCALPRNNDGGLPGALIAPKGASKSNDTCLFGVDFTLVSLGWPPVPTPASDVIEMSASPKLTNRTYLHFPTENSHFIFWSGRGRRADSPSSSPHSTAR